MNIFSQRINKLLKKMSEENLDVAIITDEDNVYYFSGYYDYLHMEFGRPTILLVSQKKGTLLITPSIDENMAKSEAQVDRIVAWNDGLGDEWRVEFPSFLHNNTVGIELNSIPQVVKTYIEKIKENQILQNLNFLRIVFLFWLLHHFFVQTFDPDRQSHDPNIFLRDPKNRHLENLFD